MPTESRHRTGQIERFLPAGRRHEGCFTHDRIQQGGVVAAISLLAIALAVLYWFPLRKWFGRWGTTPADLTRVMSGDAAVVDPSCAATLAVTVEAKPADIWPWLVQIGYQRGGLYSYDWLDRLFGYLDRPSATRILPEYQELKVGDEIPIGRGGGFPVTAIEPSRALVLGGTGDGFQWVWQFGLYPLDGKRTRLVSRNSVRVPSTLGWWLFLRVVEPAAFLMTRRMLLGLKRRAEAPAVAAQSRHAA
jgi:hypothetical protein